MVENPIAAEQGRYNVYVESFFKHLTHPTLPDKPQKFKLDPHDRDRLFVPTFLHAFVDYQAGLNQPDPAGSLIGQWKYASRKNKALILTVNPDGSYSATLDTD